MTFDQDVKKPKDAFFLRAESYFNVATEIENLDSVQTKFYLPPVQNSYGGKSLHEQSHGESFFALFKNRFKGNGIYLLDEPEAALSPARQLSFLCIMNALIKKRSQFIIATHSPIIMAYPNSTIYQLGKNEIRKIDYVNTDHYQTTKEFLNNHDEMLKELLSDGQLELFENE